MKSGVHKQIFKLKSLQVFSVYNCEKTENKFSNLQYLKIPSDQFLISQKTRQDS